GMTLVISGIGIIAGRRVTCGSATHRDSGLPNLCRGGTTMGSTAARLTNGVASVRVPKLARKLRRSMLPPQSTRRFDPCGSASLGKFDPAERQPGSAIAFELVLGAAEDADGDDELTVRSGDVDPDLSPFAGSLVDPARHAGRRIGKALVGRIEVGIAVIGRPPAARIDSIAEFDLELRARRSL